MPSPPNPTSSTGPGSAFSGKVSTDKNNSRGRGGRRGRGSSMTSTTPNESPQPGNGVKPPGRRRPPYPLKNSSAQASKHVSENKSRHNHSKLSPSPKSNDVPPSQSSNTNDVPKASKSSSDVKSNIDALVERVRASAMATNRPNTPRSHIDWAGDDDNSLPDLDDWGISPPTLPAGHTMISPIIVDGLTPLPEPATTLENQDALVKASITEPDSTSHSSVDNIPTEDIGKGLDQLKSSVTVENSVAQATSESESLVRDSPASTSLHLSLPPKPISPARKPRKYGDEKYPNATKYSRTRESRANDEVKASTTPRSQPQPLQGNDSKHKGSGEAEKGLSASIHAPERQMENKLNESKSEKPHILERHSPSKGTIPVKDLQPSVNGQPPSPHRPTNRPAHSNRRHPTTNTRTQASVVNQSNRSIHNRPVLTGAAISKIAKTIGGAAAPAARSSPLSTSTE